MTTIRETAWAKVNLTLDVLGKRPDGYHDLKSVMQTVSVSDDIEIDVGTGKPWCLKCDAPGIPCDERNLAWKAAKLYCDTLGKDPNGLEIRIVKRIPSQAGMGGGSSDAAAVLRALNNYYGNPLTLMALADLGAQEGSDVPFCVVGGTVMCEGRGEKLRVLPNMPACIFVACKPEFSISTPVLYRKLDEAAIDVHPDNDAMEQALEEGNLSKIADLIYNVFDPVVSAEYPVVDAVKEVFTRHGAVGGQMTGSGSVTFAIAPDMVTAENICAELKKNYSEVFICNPV